MCLRQIFGQRNFRGFGGVDSNRENYALSPSVCLQSDELWHLFSEPDRRNSLPLKLHGAIPYTASVFIPWLRLIILLSEHISYLETIAHPNVHNELLAQ